MSSSNRMKKKTYLSAEKKQEISQHFEKSNQMIAIIYLNKDDGRLFLEKSRNNEQQLEELTKMDLLKLLVYIWNSQKI